LPGFADAVRTRGRGARADGLVEGSTASSAFCDESDALDPDASCILSASGGGTHGKLERTQAISCLHARCREPWRCWSILSKLTAAVTGDRARDPASVEPADARVPADEFRAEVTGRGEAARSACWCRSKLGRDECPSRDGARPLRNDLGLTGVQSDGRLQLRCFEGRALEWSGILLDMASYLHQRGESSAMANGAVTTRLQEFTVRHEPSTIAPGR